VRRGILDAARELFVSEGYENVSMRKIAERIEYSPAAIYGYFPSKDEIFIALAEEGIRLFGACGGAPPEGLPAIERLRHIVLRLYRFSIEHPVFRVRKTPSRPRGFRTGTDRRLNARRDGCLRLISGRAVFRRSSPWAFSASPSYCVSTAGDAGRALVEDVLNVALAGLNTGVALGSDSAASPQFGG
jgi:AcrR family transcriptional regulator